MQAIKKLHLLETSALNMYLFRAQFRVYYSDIYPPLSSLKHRILYKLYTTLELLTLQNGLRWWK
jgi:hypothetical protein